MPRRIARGAPRRSRGGCSASPRRTWASRRRVGLDIVDLGRGTGYFSAWLARRGGRPVGVDVTRPSSRPRGACRPRPASSSLCSRRARRTCRCPTRASTSPSGVRREHLVRPSPVDSRSASPPSPGRPPDLPRQQPSGHPVRARRAGGDVRRRSSARSGACTRSRGPPGGVEFHLGHGDMVPGSARWPGSSSSRT